MDIYSESGTGHEMAEYFDWESNSSFRFWMMKVDFQSVKQAGKNPKGLFVTWIVNWLIKPFTMYAISSFFLFTVFKAFITPEVATEYLTGAVLLGAAPCTAMVYNKSFEKWRLI